MSFRRGPSALAAILTACLSVSACSPTARMKLAPLLPATDGDSGIDQSVYRLQVGDVVQIKLPLLPEFNDEVTVRPDGKISTVFAADVRAHDRTVPELTEALRQGYKHELRDPVLSVNVKSYAPYRVYVAGEVVAPGEYSTQGPNLTLSQAIARAGGLKLTGEPDEVFILRRGPRDVPVMMAARYKQVIRGTDPAADVRLARYDVVYVPRTTISEFYLFFNQYFQQFVPVSWGFSYLLNNGGTSK